VEKSEWESYPVIMREEVVEKIFFVIVLGGGLPIIMVSMEGEMLKN